MAIEENQEEQLKGPVIPSFNPQSFMDEANDVTPGQQQQQQQEEEEEEYEEEDEITYEDDFMSIQEKENEEVEFKAEDYISLGKTLGIEINTKEDLENVQSKFKVDSTSQKPQNLNYNFSSEEQTSFDNLNNALEGANASTPEALMKWHLKQTNKNADYENNPEELDYHIETLKDTGMFDSQEKQVRSKLIADITEQKDSLVSTSETRDNDSALATNQELQTEIKNYKDGFHGISLTPKDLLESFNSVRNGSVFEEIESTQANVAEMALLWKKRELFYKAFESPDPSVGVRKIMDELQNAKAKPAAGNKTLKNPHVFDPEAFLSSDDIKQISAAQ
jgi:hypothetical protein